ncbi:MAG: DUF6364 family protein [Rhodocyclaceae bacterium]
MKQNITISLDTEVLREAKVLAAKRNTSVSRLLADELEATVRRDQDYERAKRAALDLMENAKMDLGGAPIPREELHRRGKDEPA